MGPGSAGSVPAPASTQVAEFRGFLCGEGWGRIRRAGDRPPRGSRHRIDWTAPPRGGAHDQGPDARARGVPVCLCDARAGARPTRRDACARGARRRALAPGWRAARHAAELGHYRRDRPRRMEDHFFARRARHIHQARVALHTGDRDSPPATATRHTGTFVGESERSNDCIQNVRTRLGWVEEPTGHASFGYDALGQLVRTVREIDGRRAEEQQTYSPSGRVLGVAYDDGFGPRGPDQIGLAPRRTHPRHQGGPGQMRTQTSGWPSTRSTPPCPPTTPS